MIDQNVMKVGVVEPVYDRLAWGAAMHHQSKSLRLFLAKKNPGPAAVVDVLLTGVEESPDTGEPGFIFRGRFVENERNTTALAYLGLPEKAEFKALFAKHRDPGQLRLVA